MSYLDTPRLTFYGQFQADPSTVNNDPKHYDNATFQPNYQEWGDGTTNGWWNPQGTGDFRFVGCVVKSVTYEDGTTTSNPSDDWIIGKTIIDSNERVAGKIVDLDPMQQGVSELWGLTVRLANGSVDIFRGSYNVAAFFDLWTRTTSGGGIPTFSAFYQSTIKDLQWNEELVAQSRYLQELKAKSENELSIKFNTDHYNPTHETPTYTLGRITGSIGPYSENSPKRFTIGRQFVQSTNNNIYNATGVLNTLTNGKKLFSLDLGNSFQTNLDTGEIVETRDLYLATIKDGTITPISEIDYKTPNWYDKTAGIVNIELTDAQSSQVENTPLCIATKFESTYTSLLPETQYYARADQFVFRLNPPQSSEAEYYATYLGKLAPNIELTFKQNSVKKFFYPETGKPEAALTFPDSITTDSSGKAVLNIAGTNPGNPRDYIDGQIYAVVSDISSSSMSTANGSDNLQNIDSNSYLSIQIYETFAPSPVTWESIQPTLQQYSNLYPLMSIKLFDFSNQEIFDRYANILYFAFSLEMENPNHMPVTRDLSDGKRQAILTYLEQVLNLNTDAQKQAAKAAMPAH